VLLTISWLFRASWLQKLQSLRAAVGMHPKPILAQLRLRIRSNLQVNAQKIQ
jgi:hypothetical protein